LTEEAFVSMSFGCNGESEEDLTCEEVGVCLSGRRGEKSSRVQFSSSSREKKSEREWRRRKGDSRRT